MAKHKTRLQNEETEPNQESQNAHDRGERNAEAEPGYNIPHTSTENKGVLFEGSHAGTSEDLRACPGLFYG